MAVVKYGPAHKPTLHQPAVRLADLTLTCTYLSILRHRPR